MSSATTSRSRRCRSRTPSVTRRIPRTDFSECRPYEFDSAHIGDRLMRLCGLPCPQGSRGTPWGRFGDRPVSGGAIDTLRLTAEEAVRLLEGGEASAAELHRAYVNQIEERDPELHSYLKTVDEPDGPGVPVAFKDLISTKGVETTAGSKILEGYVPVFDATVASRCKEAGLSLL